MPLCWPRRFVTFWHGKFPIDSSRISSWQLLSHWQALPAIPMDKEPATEQEGVFWHLLHSLHLWDEHQLVTDTWLRQQLMACATFLVAEGPCPRHCIGSRP